MTDARPPVPGRLAFAAVGLMVLGVGFWALFALTRGGEPHAFAPDAQAPYTVHLTQGSTYQLAVPHGTDTAGLAQGSADCIFTEQDGTQQALTASANSSKAIDQVASFVAPVSGTGHVQCVGLQQVFVEGVPGSSFDRSGLFLLLATVALTIGVPLMLTVAHSALRESEPADELG